MWRMGAESCSNVAKVHQMWQKCAKSGKWAQKVGLRHGCLRHDSPDSGESEESEESGESGESEESEESEESGELEEFG